jgi:hypothetical protein
MALDQRSLMIRSYLIGAAGRPDSNLPTYGELHQAFGGGYQNQGRFLQAIYEECRDHNEPDLSVLVVGSESQVPSRFEGKDWKDSPETRKRWHDELRNVRSWKWSNTRYLS